MVVNIIASWLSQDNLTTIAKIAEIEFILLRKYMKLIFQIFLMFIHQTKTCILLHYYQGFCAHVFLFWHALNQGSRRKASVAGLSCNHTNHTLLDLRQRLVLGLRIAAKLIHQEKSRSIQCIKISLPIKVNSEPIGVSGPWKCPLATRLEPFVSKQCIHFDAILLVVLCLQLSRYFPLVSKSTHFTCSPYSAAISIPINCCWIL